MGGSVTRPYIFMFLCGFNQQINAISREKTQGIQAQIVNVRNPDQDPQSCENSKGRPVENRNDRLSPNNLHLETGQHIQHLFVKGLVE